jgi:hyperosmotically inducible protein
MNPTFATRRSLERPRFAAVAGVLAIALSFGGCESSSTAAPTDAQIRQEVAAILEARNLTGITVDVRGGLVTLGGQAADQAAVDRAIEAARLVDGVRQVESQIAVAPPDEKIEPEKPDTLLQARVDTALLANRDLAGARIRTAVAGGVATLTGTVPSEAAKASAERTAAGLTGIASVNNQLQVVAETAPVTVPDEQIKNDVETLLDTEYPDLLLTVDVKAGQVTIKGAVNTRNQIVEIARKVRQIKGVINVDTRLLTILGGEGNQRIGTPGTNSP